ncbi:O(6)-methylguanine-induced apoptosis 2 [Sardina pilchardus]|uniref:O(6)-methylguanine-induced apoptosis 2 n=1 Tax=Sardina pilchardus TaxID=27697 RepID=UPI002E0DEF28
MTIMRNVHRSSSDCYKPFGCTSSIPVKYQTVVISNEEKKGFCSKSKRFLLEDSLNENPGPGAYLSHMPAENNSPSFSKKGTGGFASKAHRVSRNVHRGIPGPNAYNLQSSLLPKHTFLRGSTRNFRLPVAVKLDSMTERTPAPNQYNVSYGGVDKSTTISAQSVFLSKTARNVVSLNGLKGPSPCHYNVNDTITQKDPKVPYSCFKSNIARNPIPLKSEGPGPGAYNPYQTPEMVKRTILPRRHYLGLSAPPLKPPENPPLPGPGQYDIVNYEGSPRHFMSTAAFVSGTSRWVQNPKGHDVPGPGFYDPEIMSKRSFIYNHRKNWVPV